MNGRRLLAAAAFLLHSGGPAVAQQADEAPAPLRALQERAASVAERDAAFAELVKTVDQVLQLVEDLRRKNEALTGQVAELTDLLALERQTTEDLSEARTELGRLLGRARADGDALKGQLADAGQLLARSEDRVLQARKVIEAKDAQLDDLDRARMKTDEQVRNERRISAEAQAEVELLNRQLAHLRRQMDQIQAALNLSESRNTENQGTIAELGRRLNAALAQKVEELARYRSEFFGRLREVLGDRPDMRVVGDRFVFQAEVLFAPGSAELSQDARSQLVSLAQALNEIAGRIPAEISWVLRIDGHTDTLPIRTPQFPSNWELSTARAVSVLKFLISQGIGPERVVAAGFGEFHPLDPRKDEIGYRRNRRIEFKLTER